ncbi:MAG: hypothetical protein WCT20_03635 [Candidatus Babeliales bacterium]
MSDTESVVLTGVHGSIAQEIFGAKSGKNHHLVFRSFQASSHLLKATIEVGIPVIEQLGKETIELFKQGNFEGFADDGVPDEYILENFNSEIHERIKGYVFRHLVIDFLITELLDRQIMFANYPRLMGAELLPGPKMLFHFDVSMSDSVELKEWKLFLFKLPKRKRYKDLDKQVEQFLEAQTAVLAGQNMQKIEEDDWVCFDATLIDRRCEVLDANFTSRFWLRANGRGLQEQFSAMFAGHAVGDQFTTNNFDFDETQHEIDGKRYNFLINIKGVIKGNALSMDLFKTTFRLKNKVEVHGKLMEVFSYRNDISQRKMIIEELFHLLLTKHRFEVAKHLVLRRVEDLLVSLMKQPDYQVYKSQKDFFLQVEQLAEKQLKEEIIIDQIAYSEGIAVDFKDMQHYLHLFNNKRLREFVYFKSLIEKIDELEAPINANILAQAVLREKVLNHIIYTLTH